MPPIKVCHFTSVHPWNDIRIFEKECVSLAEAGFEVHLVAPNAAEGLHKNVHVHSVPNTETGRLYRIRTLTKHVYQKALSIDAEIYHFHDPELLPYGLKLQKKGKKVIFDSHEDVPLDILDKEWIKPGLLRRFISWVYNTYEKRITRRLSGVVSVLDYITEKFAPVRRVTIHNYPRLNDFKSGPEIPVATVPPDIFTIVYNGGLSQIRNIDKMVAALQYLDMDYRLLLMGNWESTEYEAKCKSTPGWDKVTYLGNVPLKECFAQVKSAQLGVVLFSKIANHLNSLPNKSFEYIAAEIPMLMSDIPFWEKEFSRYAHFADPDVPQNIAEQIRQIKSNYALEKEKCIVESRRILNEKSWESEEKKLVSFYGEIQQTL